MNRFAKYPSELVELSLFVLLVFAENYLRKIFPENLFDTKTEEMTESSGWLLIIAGGLGIFTFFRKPQHTSEDFMKMSWSAALGTIAAYMGGLFIAALLCFMIVFGFIELGSVYAPNEGSTLFNAMMVVFAILLIGFMIAPWMLISHYGNNYDKLKYMHPSLRYLCLLPAIFLSAAFMNQATDNAFSYGYYGEDRNIWEVLFSSLFSFAMCSVSTRLFATGERIEWKGWLMWLVRFALFFCGMYFDF